MCRWRWIKKRIRVNHYLHLCFCGEHSPFLTLLPSMLGALKSKAEHPRRKETE